MHNYWHTLEKHLPNSFNQKEKTLVENALNLAVEAHKGQFRVSGEDYINHPLRVAQLCCNVDLDAATVAAALLHDVVEDTEITLDELQKQFGGKVTHLVNGATKIKSFPETKTRSQKDAENYRKLLLATAEDWRVLIIKLADRMDNMRTLDALEEKRAQRIATETIQIYAPLAHRLGIYSWKAELEDRALEILDKAAYDNIRKLVAEKKEQREKQLIITQKELTKELTKEHLSAEISGRAKHFYSIYRKMNNGIEFDDMYDLLAMRIVVEDLPQCYAALGVVHSKWRPLPHRIKDYIATPKDNMYQSLHTTVMVDSKPLEIQIRTHAMHELAEWGIAAHVLYKERKGKISPDEMKWLMALREWQTDLSSAEFLDDLQSNLREKEVFVFTPQGELLALAQGSTPLDFAYAVHTEIGHTCRGARINGRIAPLHTKLKNGAQIEIIGGNKSGPSRDWLSLVVTRGAKNRIRSYFRGLDKADAETKGREELYAHLEKAGLPVTSPLLVDVGYKLLGKKIKSSDFYRAIGENQIETKTIIRLIQQELQREKPLVSIPNKPTEIPLVRITGSKETNETVEIEIAQCCQPIPPDPIIGYVSLGRGVRVHHKECANITNGQRLIDVSWANTDMIGSVQITILGWDRPKLLSDITATLSENGADIITAACTTNEDSVVNNIFTVKLPKTIHLNKMIVRLRQIDGVFDAQKTNKEEN